MPPHWADAHHLVHWADFGPSDLDNAALLCERHHTDRAHQRRLAGEVVQGPTGEQRQLGPRAAAPTTTLLARARPADEEPA